VHEDAVWIAEHQKQEVETYAQQQSVQTLKKIHEGDIMILKEVGRQKKCAVANKQKEVLERIRMNAPIPIIKKRVQDRDRQHQKLASMKEDELKEHRRKRADAERKRRHQKMRTLHRAPYLGLLVGGKDFRLASLYR